MADHESSSGATSDKRAAAPPVFDAMLAPERVDGDKDLLLEIAGLYLEDVPRVLPELRRATADFDVKAIEHLAHSIKGSVGNVGGLAAHEAALRLEERVKAGGEEEIAGSVDRLIHEIDQLTAALETEVAKGISA